MNKRPRLELTWIGKEDRPRLEPRILLEDPELSYRAPKRVTDHDIFDNQLIHGDNLLALKALEQEFEGRIKCVFIDPPYNTGSAFQHYDDGIEHSLWLSLMRDRLELIRKLLKQDGSLWITVDDNEAHYLKVLCDEVFGRPNFVANAIWQKKYTIANDAKWLSENHDHILVYAVDKAIWRPYRLQRSSDMDDRYRNPDGHPKGRWKATPLYAKRTGSEKEQRFSYTFKNGVVWSPPRGTSPRFPAEGLRRMDKNDEIWFGADGTAVPARKTFLSELTVSGPPSATIWLHNEAGNNHEARDEVRAFNPDNPFDTPKPEKLVKRVLELATLPGDLVLDSFAGSGTTGAVSHKMGRRWIMVELGSHCHTHIIPRMRQVVDGLDTGGVSKAVDWSGGGGFRFFRLAPSLLEKDKWGNWIVSKKYKPEMLAEAMCKLEGFQYAPDRDLFWIHGKSTERDFIYVTTQSLSRDQLQFISDQVGSERSLLICCSAFRAKNDFPNLTVKKIPQAVLSRCQWGRDDYSLNVEELPPVEAAEALESDAISNRGDKGDGPKRKPKGRRKDTAMQTLPLFASLDEGAKRRR
jgi:adenine-specific DNA-methyltransferase